MEAIKRINKIYNWRVSPGTKGDLKRVLFSYKGKEVIKVGERRGTEGNI
jgi:hypothetical protein